jgi:hypothetical protein
MATPVPGYKPFPEPFSENYPGTVRLKKKNELGLKSLNFGENGQKFLLLSHETARFMIYNNKSKKIPGK